MKVTSFMCFLSLRAGRFLSMANGPFKGQGQEYISRPRTWSFTCLPRLRAGTENGPFKSQCQGSISRARAWCPTIDIIIRHTSTPIFKAAKILLVDTTWPEIVNKRWRKVRFYVVNIIQSRSCLII